MSDNINNSGVTVSNPSPAPQGSMIIANAPSPDRAFPIHLVSGKPCIVGNAARRLENSDQTFTVVYSPSGKRTATHPLPLAGKCLYEIHVGDFIGHYQRQGSALFIRSFYVTHVTAKAAIGTLAIM